MQKKSFGSDNHAGIHPAILEAIAEANLGDAPAYGGDDHTLALDRVFREHFGSHARAFPVFTGTGANVLGISLLTRRYEAVICPASAHINTDECGAIESVLGIKLLGVDTPDGKLTPRLVAPLIATQGDEHHVQPRVVSVSQASETGTCYSPGELRELADWAHEQGLLVHLDGARIANAAATFGCSLRDASSGVDVLSFGGTKNGLMGAEAVVVLNEELAEQVSFHRKQMMQLASKMRFLSAQLTRLLEDGLWLTNAASANTMAQRLANGLREVPGVNICFPVQANAVFAALPTEAITVLRASQTFYVWDEDRGVVRLMTAFDTTPEHVDAFLADVRHACEAASRAAEPSVSVGPGSPVEGGTPAGPSASLE